MKIKIVILTGLAGLMLASCIPAEQKQAEPQSENVPAEITSTEGLTSYWECPMKCEGKKFAAAGICPVCKMELKKVIIAQAPSAPADTGMTGTAHEHDAHAGHNH